MEIEKSKRIQAQDVGLMFNLGIYTSHTPDGSQIIFYTWPLLTCFKRREERVIGAKEEPGVSDFRVNSPPATLELGRPRNGSANKGQLFGTVCNSVEIELSDVVSCIMFQPAGNDGIMMDARGESG
jgi:hypothetical protein